MKKIILLLAFTISLSCISCGNTRAAENTSEVQVEEVLSEELTESNLEDIVEPNDSAKATSRSGSDSEGFGRCSKCACKKFEGRGDVCKNCGHAYKKHY